MSKDSLSKESILKECEEYFLSLYFQSKIDKDLFSEIGGFVEQLLKKMYNQGVTDSNNEGNGIKEVIHNFNKETFLKLFKECLEDGNLLFGIDGIVGEDKGVYSTVLLKDNRGNSIYSSGNDFESIGTFLD